MCVRVWGRICEDEDFATSLWLLTRESSHVRSTCWNLKSLWQTLFRESLRNLSQVVSDPRNSLLDYISVCLFSFLYQHFINPHYPWNVRRTRIILKKLLREKTLAKHLRVRGCLPTILYIISLELPFTPTSSSTYHWEVLSSNTYLTNSECWEKFLCLWEALKEVSEWRMQSGRIAGSR